jgi:hypothetical protein
MRLHVFEQIPRKALIVSEPDLVHERWISGKSRDARIRGERKDAV